MQHDGFWEGSVVYRLFFSKPYGFFIKIIPDAAEFVSSSVRLTLPGNFFSYLKNILPDWHIISCITRGYPPTGKIHPTANFSGKSRVLSIIAEVQNCFRQTKNNRVDEMSALSVTSFKHLLHRTSINNQIA